MRKTKEKNQEVNTNVSTEKVASLVKSSWEISMTIKKIMIQMDLGKWIRLPQTATQVF